MKFKQFGSLKEKELFLKNYLKEFEAEHVFPVFHEEVFCQICKKKFKMSQFKVLILECECCGEPYDLIVCHHAPECEGAITDFIPLQLLN